MNTKTWRQRRRGCFLAVVVVLFASCSGGSGLRAEVEAAAGESDVFAADSPLDRFFLVAGGKESAFERWERQVLDDTVTCMKSRGFEMVVDIAPSSERDQSMSRLTEREWTEVYGYGLADSFVDVLADQVGDPNERIVTGLSEAEREQYFVALVGEVLAAAGGRPDEAPPLDRQGCSGQAVLANGGQDLVDGLAPFETAYAERISRISSSAQMTVAADEWARCMAAAGYPGYGHQDDIVAEVQAQILDVTEPFRSTLDEDELGEIVGLGVQELMALSGFPTEGFDEVAANEVQVALADLDCYEVHVAPVWEPMRNEEEYGLIDEFGDVLVKAQSAITE